MKTINCEKCDGAGFYPAANGPDDFEMEVCRHVGINPKMIAYPDVPSKCRNSSHAENALLFGSCPTCKSTSPFSLV